MRLAVKHPLLSIDRMSWSQVSKLRLLILIGVGVMTLSGSDALAQVSQGVGVSETDMVVTMRVYISSIVTVGGAFFILGRWTSRRENEHQRIERELRDLRELVTKLQSQGETHHEAGKAIDR